MLQHPRILVTDFCASSVFTTLVGIHASPDVQISAANDQPGLEACVQKGWEWGK